MLFWWSKNICDKSRWLAVLGHFFILHASIEVVLWQYSMVLSSILSHRILRSIMPQCDLSEVILHERFILVQYRPPRLWSVHLFVFNCTPPTLLLFPPYTHHHHPLFANHKASLTPPLINNALPRPECQFICNDCATLYHFTWTTNRHKFKDWFFAMCVGGFFSEKNYLPPQITWKELS